MSMYECTYVYAYVMYVCVCIYAYAMYVCTFMIIDMWIYVICNVCMYVCMCNSVCIYAYVSVWMFVYNIYVCVCIYVYVMYLCVWMNVCLWYGKLDSILLESYLNLDFFFFSLVGGVWQRFFFRSQLLGQVRYRALNCKDYAWVTKEELLEYFELDLSVYMKQMLVDDLRVIYWDFQILLCRML